ncbi:MAG: hypothetical protein ACRD21_13375 [Vicinamibacteria bacterium]
MRRKKAGLEDVLGQFEAWRAKPHGRLIPDELWNAALGLLDRYRPSRICSHLRLNAGRFRQIREARGVVVGDTDAMGRGRSGAARRGRRRCSAAEQVFALAPSRDAFVELPQFGVGFGGGIMAARPRDVERVPAGCRLTLESGTGTLTVVTANHEHSLVEAVCRFALGALTDSSRT